MTFNPKVLIRYFNVAMVLLIVGLFTYGFQKSQTHQRELLEAQKASTEEVNRHLDCIIVYFSLPARTELTITDINKCTIDRNGTPEQFFQTNQSTGEVEVKNQAVSGLKAPSLPSSQSESKPSSIQPFKEQPAQSKIPTEPEQKGFLPEVLEDTETYLDKITKGLINGR